MATLTIRNVRPGVVKRLKSMAREKRHSMEQEVRELLEAHAVDRRAVIEEAQRLRERQTRPPTAEEIEGWIEVGRE